MLLVTSVFSFQVSYTHLFLDRVAKILGSKEDRHKTDGLTQQKKSKWTSMFHISNKDKVSQLSSHTKKLSISNPKIYSVDHATVLKTPSLTKDTKDTNFKQIYEEPSKYLMPTLEQDDDTNNKENLSFSGPKSKTNIVMGIKASNQTRRVLSLHYPSQTLFFSYY